MRLFRSPRLTVLALARETIGTRKLASFRAAENSSNAVAGQQEPIVHTDRAFVRRLTSCLTNKTA
jgi:hypothetical protein